MLLVKRRRFGHVVNNWKANSSNCIWPGRMLLALKRRVPTLMLNPWRVGMFAERYFLLVGNVQLQPKVRLQIRIRTYGEVSVNVSDLALAKTTLQKELERSSSTHVEVKTKRAKDLGEAPDDLGKKTKE